MGCTKCLLLDLCGTLQRTYVAVAARPLMLSPSLVTSYGTQASAAATTVPPHSPLSPRSSGSSQRAPSNGSFNSSASSSLCPRNPARIQKQVQGSAESLVGKVSSTFSYISTLLFNLCLTVSWKCTKCYMIVFGMRSRTSLTLVQWKQHTMVELCGWIWLWLVKLQEPWPQLRYNRSYIVSECAITSWKYMYIWEYLYKSLKTQFLKEFIMSLNEGQTKTDNW